MYKQIYIVKCTIQEEINVYKYKLETKTITPLEPFALSAEVQRSQLLTELWFHASISRQAAEALLKHDGDFLVRESQGKPGQYVLTGLQAQTPKHLLLIDPEGTVSYTNYNIL